MKNLAFELRKLLAQAEFLEKCRGKNDRRRLRDILGEAERVTRALRVLGGPTDPTNIWQSYSRTDPTR